MSLMKEEFMNEVYNAGLITLGAVGVAVVSKKLFRDDLGVPTTTRRIFKLVAAVGSGALRPDSTPAKFFARSCLCEIRMVGHD